MKWIYSIKNKLTASMLLLVVLGVVFLNNLSERSNSEEISKSLSAIYEDRLVAERYIFQYSMQLQKIIDCIDNEQLAANNKQQVIGSQLNAMEQVNADYGKTKFTGEETRNFKAFNDCFVALGRQNLQGNFDGIRQTAQKALDLLEPLSQIQVYEAKTEMNNAGKLFKSGFLSSQFEMAVLIIIAVIIQALLFASKTLQSQLPGESKAAQLN